MLSWYRVGSLGARVLELTPHKCVIAAQGKDYGGHSGGVIHSRDTLRFPHLEPPRKGPILVSPCRYVPCLIMAYATHVSAFNYVEIHHHV